MVSGNILTLVEKPSVIGAIIFGSCLAVHLYASPDNRKSHEKPEMTYGVKGPLKHLCELAVCCRQKTTISVYITVV